MVFYEGCIRDFEECDCDCHTNPNKKHVGDCCNLCRWCGKNIALGELAHEEGCKKKNRAELKTLLIGVAKKALPDFPDELIDKFVEEFLFQHESDLLRPKKSEPDVCDAGDA